MGSNEHEECVRDELRTLFLFERLSDEQLEILCANGHIETLPAGPGVPGRRARDVLLRDDRR